MEPLKTDYKNDVLDTSKNQLRKYQQIQNDDGTVSFVDVTEYSTTGTSFGAKDINDTNAAVNELNNSLSNFIKVVQATAPLTLSIGAQDMVSLKFTPPDGYTPIVAIPHSAQAWDWVWCECSLSSSSTVSAIIKWATNSTASGTQTQTISANVICVKNIVQ